MRQLSTLLLRKAKGLDDSKLKGNAKKAIKKQREDLLVDSLNWAWSSFKDSLDNPARKPEDAFKHFKVF